MSLYPQSFLPFLLLSLLSRWERWMPLPHAMAGFAAAHLVNWQSENKLLWWPVSKLYKKTLWERSGNVKLEVLGMALKFWDWEYFPMLRIKYDHFKEEFQRKLKSFMNFNFKGALWSPSFTNVTYSWPLIFVSLNLNDSALLVHLIYFASVYSWYGEQKTKVCRSP